MSITVDRLREVLDYDQVTGLFTWRSKRSNAHIVGQSAGSKHSRGYIAITVDGKPYFAHRLAWLYVHGCWPSMCIDHIDGNRRNNGIDNLRDVTMSMNNQNRRAAQRGTFTGLIGTSFKKDRGKFQSHIRIDGRNVALGYFETAEQAHAAYIEAKRIAHRGCMI